MNLQARLKRKKLESYIKKYLSYNPKTGIIHYRKPTGRGINRKEIGDVAGHLLSIGYVTLSINATNIFAHHVAWFLYYGMWPDKIDHKDRNRANNKIKNLRLALNGNQQNRSVSTRNTSGHTGVSWHKGSHSWRAVIYVGNKQKSLGYHRTKEKAIKAYAEGKKKFHKFHSDVVTGKASYPNSTHR